MEHSKRASRIYRWFETPACFHVHASFKDSVLVLYSGVSELSFVDVHEG